MESNITEPQFFNDPKSLSEPHFDEEATVLSARPVVPLDEVTNEAQSIRRWPFVIAILAALLIGAGGAAFIYERTRGDESVAQESTTPASYPDESSQEAQAFTGVEGGVVGFGEPHSEPETEMTQASVEQPDPAPVQKNESEENEKRVVAVAPRAVPATRRDTEPDSDPERDIRREPATYDEIEIRRAERREARRLKLGKRGRASDDLTRIREIFEGSPRP